MYDEDGNIKPFLTETTIRDFVKVKIDNYLRTLFDDAKAYWTSNGITHTLLDKSYYENIKKGLKGTEDNVNEMALDTAIADYIANTTLWNMSVSTLLMGDPANAEWKGSVEKTMAEYAKRLAKDIAPRQQLMFDSPLYTQLTVDDVEMKYKYAEQFGSNVHKSKATDAQEFTTVREHLNVMRAAGKLSDEMYHKIGRAHV